MLHAVSKRREVQAKLWNCELYNKVIQPLLRTEAWHLPAERQEEGTWIWDFIYYIFWQTPTYMLYT